MSVRTSLFTWLTITACILSIPAAANAKTIYVNDDATGVNNGPSRSGFQSGVQYPSIQAAINAAIDGDTIILAPGAFRGEGNRDIDFNGKAITVRSTDPNDPNIVAATIIDCNGTEDEPHRGFYFHSGEDANSILAGVTIMNGYAEDGGGVYCESSSPTLRKCSFTRNSAQAFEDCSGGGMDNYNDQYNQCSPTLINCTFANNRATNDGGAIYNYQSSPTLTKCTLSNNSAVRGGGIHNFWQSSPVLVNCKFKGNFARASGGGIFNYYGCRPVVDKCIFSNNRVLNGTGGGIFNEESSQIVRNCVFSGNLADTFGGGVSNFIGTLTLTNCTFIGNLADAGGGIASWLESDLTVNNCIVWGNMAVDGAALYLSCPHSSSRASVVWSDIEGGIEGVFTDTDCGLNWGESNIGADPCFADPGYWDPNGTPDDANDDFWVDGDYHLKSQAGRWEPNSETWLLDDITSPCIDVGDPISPIGNEPFPNGGIVNMGAYGGTTEASKSYFGKPPCETIVAGDINGDCEVNFLDFRLMALHWMEGHD